MPLPTIEWLGDLDGTCRLIDQTRLPLQKEFLDIKTIEEMWHAIKRLSVRGAPAIGIAAAMGLVLGIRNFNGSNTNAFLAEVEKASTYLAKSRPTAVNLFWALDRVEKVAKENKDKPVPEIKTILLKEAIAILEEDKILCKNIGENGKHLIKNGNGVLTHCNAGGLATGAYGTALSLMFSAQAAGTNFKVFADETRPLLQGARLTTFELQESGIDVSLICDNMAGHCMQRGMIDLVIVGTDRIAANGDVANKIGTYSVAVLAKYHKIPFYVAAPSTTFDLKTSTGIDIPIEERKAEEITCGFGKRTAPENIQVYNPAFDVTPANLIQGIITEKGIIENPTTEKVRKHLEAQSTSKQSVS
jgi:methylthioribose-1-phosphate isomerase